MKKVKNDLTLKILAFVIAIILWSNVMNEVNPERSTNYKNIGVTFNNIGSLDRQGLVVMDPEEIFISVEVLGRKSDMANFEREFIKAQVDLTGYSEGQVKVPIKINENQLGNIKVINYEPKEILFTFEKLITKPKPVTIKTTGKLDSEYVLGDLSTKTGSILLKGPRSWVNEVAEIIAVVDLSGRKENGNVTVPIRILNDQGNDVRDVEKEPSVIDVNVPIFRTAILPIELQYINQLPENYEITEVTIKPNRIALKGDNSIANLTLINTKPIDINSLIEDTAVEVELDLPGKVSLLNPDEKVIVSLKIEEAYTKTFEYSLSEIDIRNLSDGLTLDEESLSKTIKIIVKGSSAIIESLTKEDLEVYLDLNRFDEGTHKIYIGFNIPTGVTVKEITPQPIELKLINR